MQAQPNPLWQHLARLGGVEWPRVCEWSGREPSNPRQGRINLGVLGQDWFLRRPQTVERVLGLLQEGLRLDPRTWREQRPFLAEFIGSFFTPSDRPAWIKIHAVRHGFAKRLSDAGAPFLHRGILHASPGVALDQRRTEGLMLGSVSLPRAAFRVHHPGGISQRGVRMQRVFILRTLHAGPEGRILDSTEERLVAVRDEEDIRLASRGITPALERFRNAADVHGSPLVSLCRQDASGRTLHRCFSLSPGQGEIADLRTVAYSPEYYFRSDMTSHAMLEQLIAPGRYEAL